LAKEVEEPPKPQEKRASFGRLSSPYRSRQLRGPEALQKTLPQSILDRFSIIALKPELGPNAKVLSKYQVESAEVMVVNDDGLGRYLVSEPEVDDEDRELYRLLMAQLYYSVKPTLETGDPVVYIEKFIDEIAQEFKISDQLAKSYPKLRYYMTREIAGYGVLNVPMKDPHVEEVECSGSNTAVTVVHRDFSQFLRLETNIQFSQPSSLDDMVQKFAQRAGKSTTVAYPYTDFLLPEGHRGAVTFSNEVSLPGSTFDIRKFPEEPLSITDLIAGGTLSPLLAAYYWLLAENKGFTLLVGPASAGKTTMLNVLLNLLRPDAKVLTVEDTPELRVSQDNWIRFITRTSYTLGGREVGLFELVKLSLRYRPDYLVLGEVRGEEIQSLVQAAALGHGALTTFHADTVQSALVRLRSPPLSVGESFLLLISNFLRMGKITRNDGTQARRVLESTEVLPEKSATAALRTKTIFTLDPATDRLLPTDPKEVVARSERLDVVRINHGWTPDELSRQLESRAKLLQGLVDNKTFAYKDVSRAIVSFYQGHPGSDGAEK
jgi:flagellar protein FlaI